MPKHNACKQRWETRVNELLTTVEVIQDPDDASPQGQFEKILDSFLTGKVQARQKDEIMDGKPWHDLMRTKFILDLRIFLYSLSQEDLDIHPSIKFGLG